MKKMIAALIGIVISITCVFALVGCGSTDVEAMNKAGYDKAMEVATHDLAGFGEVTVEPKITRDGLVVCYKVLVDGDYAGQIKVY